MNPVLIAENITKYRLLARLNKKSLAKSTKLSPNYISLLENRNNDKIPSMDTLAKIAYALGVEVDQLLHGNLVVYDENENKALTDEIVAELNKMDDEKLSFFTDFVQVYGEYKD